MDAPWRRSPILKSRRSGRASGQRQIEPHPYLVIGERVRIKAGAMMGLEGILVRKKNNFRVVLALDVIMQSVAVEVDADDLEPAAKSAGRVVGRQGFAREPNQQILTRTLL